VDEYAITAVGIPTDDDSHADYDEETSTDATEGSDEGDLVLDHSREGVRIDKNDRSLSEFRRWYEEGRLVIDPEWQRSYVWDVRRASKLIESFLVDIPVPVIYLAKDDSGKYLVIDGVQRLSSVFKFVNGEFALTGLELQPNINKKRFADLPQQIQSKLFDATLRTFELSPQTSRNLLFVIFQRLNSGGVALNEMEIRNCVYTGKLNTLIKQLATYDEFVKTVNQKDLSRRMSDRSLVLRFLAFYERGYQRAQTGLKAFLNDFCEIYRNPPDARLEVFRRNFKHAMRASHTVFGQDAFRLRRQDARGGGEWATRVNATVFQVITVSFTNYDLAQITQRADAIYEEYLDLVSTDSTWEDCVTKSTGDAAKIRYAFETWGSRLASVMANSVAADGQRIFSRALKREMFQQNPMCAICGQEIRLMNDAALDHEEHYWRGGQTVPSNARLVHRLCNMKRPK
jgi:hypothetical protein